jgi:hypothetical protein
VGLRRQVTLALAVALAGVGQRADGVDAQVLQHVLGPAAAVGVAFEQPFGCELAAGAGCHDVALEIRVAAEQAEAVLDLPFDLDGRADGLGVRGPVEAGTGEEGGEGGKGNGSHHNPNTQSAIDSG